MEATCFFETSVDFQQDTRRHIPEGSTLHSHRCENLKSYSYYETDCPFDVCSVVAEEAYIFFPVGCVSAAGGIYGR
jgi:hypothetical protein